MAWVRQSGTAGPDAANGVSVDDQGNVYIAGETAGAMDGVNSGDTDAFVAKYGPDGKRIWVRQLGTTERDDAGAVTTDRDGNVYIAGLTFGGLDGPNHGAYDAFVAKFDSDGTRLWVAQFGTADRDYASSVTTDREGNAYIAGDTFGALGGANVGVADAYLLKIDSNGRQVWARQLGSAQGDVAKGVATDPQGNVYIAGQTDGKPGQADDDLGSPGAAISDAFVARYTSAGDLVWVRNYGSEAMDYANTITAADDGDIWIAGITEGDLGDMNAGGPDGFVARLDGTGDKIWATQFGTSGSDWATGVSSDTDGTAYVSAFTDGDLGGPSAGQGDALVAAFSSDGTPLWSRQIGTSANEIAKAVSAGADGNVVIAGQTGGSVEGESAGGFDAFVARY